MNTPPFTRTTARTTHTGTTSGSVAHHVRRAEASAELAVVVHRAITRTFELTLPVGRTMSTETRAKLALLSEAVVACACGEPSGNFTPYAWTPEAATLLASLRTELLCGRSRRALGEGDLLRVLTAVEQLSQVLADDIAVRFTRQFSGPAAQQRLVELAHDMRSPLNAIMLLVERMQQGQSGAVSAVQQQHLALVYSAAFGLVSMANDLTDVARGGARLLANPPSTFSLSELLRSVRSVVQPLAEERRLALRFSGPRTDSRVGVVAALHRVLLNLTTNALNFTTVGAVTVVVQERADDPDVLTFTVEDTGRGIPEAQLADIFTAMSPKSHELVETFSADGLGLAICRKLVTAMQGELSVDSRAGQGTRFSFTLRLPRS